MPSASARNSLEVKITQWQTQLDGAAAYLRNRGCTRETAVQFRLGFDGTRLVIPYLTVAGPWTYKLRCVEHADCKAVGHKEKYIAEPGASLHLFNAGVLLDADRVVVVEGELDAVACTQAGVAAVGYPGANNWQKYFRWAFDSCDDILVVADGDDAGRKAAGTVAASLRGAVGGDVRVVAMPDGHDASSFIAEYGEEEFLLETEWL